MYVLDDLVGRYLVKLVSVSCDPADVGCVLIRIQLGSLLALSFLDRLGTLGTVAVVPLPAATDAHERGAHERGEGVEVELAFSCVRRNRISSCSSAF